MLLKRPAEIMSRSFDSKSWIYQEVLEKTADIVGRGGQYWLVGCGEGALMLRGQISRNEGGGKRFLTDLKNELRTF
jgi:uncharacterized protein CbrC (UPF0167 family)